MIPFQVPDEALLYLRGLLEEDGNLQWKIGELICDLWDEMLTFVKPEEERDYHAELIRKLAAGTGADKTTLRDREKMWRFWWNKPIEDYPAFTYHQFRALKSAGEKEWKHYADLAGDEGWSVAQIRRAIRQDKDAREELLKRLDRIEKTTRNIMDDEEVSETVRESLMLIPSIIQDTKELV